MSSLTLPPPCWFDAALDIVNQASTNIKVDDFLSNLKLKPYVLGNSFTYRVDVLNHLIRDDVIRVIDQRLTVGSTDNISWLTMALKSGFSCAWKFVESIEGVCSEEMKFDAESLKEIGNEGELFVIDMLKRRLSNDLHNKIVHIAKKNDIAGFDILAPSVLNSDITFKLEVKTSTRISSSGVEFFLSRNEFEIGRINRNWCLVFVAIFEGEKKILGHMYCYQIESRIPRDVDERARWQSCKINVEHELLRKDLP